jgi:type IV pilus assembly protein PilY1
VRISVGALLSTIDTSGAGAGATAPCTGANGGNGLGSPTALDTDQNGTTDFVYAGDLQGNLWKFDLRSSDPSQWGVAYATNGSVPLPLFTAAAPSGGNTLRQPIVAAPNVAPSPGIAYSYLVYFVTGRIFAVGDAGNTSTQSLYAVQDAGAPVSAGRSQLVQQTIVPATGGNENVQTPYPTVSLTTSSGWYVDFTGTGPGSGERALNTPFLGGGMVIVSTVIPQVQPCNGGCGGFIYALNPYSGDGGMQFLKVNNVYYDAIASTVGCIKGLTFLDNGSMLDWYAVGPGPSSASSSTGNGSATAAGQGPGNTGVPLAQSGSTPSFQQGSGSPTSPGRISWHEVAQ